MKLVLTQIYDILQYAKSDSIFVRNVVRKQHCLRGWLEEEWPGLPSGRSIRTTFDLQKTSFQQTSGSKGKWRKQKKKAKATAAFS